MAGAQIRLSEGSSQAAKTSDAARVAYLAAVERPGTPEPADRWYKENTRESIRDDTLRYGLVAIGAVLVKSDVPTTSRKGRYVLHRDLAVLFDPGLDEAEFDAAAAAWRDKHLTRNALATVRVLQIAAAGAESKVPVALPNGEVRVMAPGLSSIITKAVVEVFAPRFLINPAVPWISESGKKVVEKDDKLLRILGIEIKPRSCCRMSSLLIPARARFCSCSSRSWRRMGRCTRIGGGNFLTLFRPPVSIHLRRSSSRRFGAAITRPSKSPLPASHGGLSPGASLNPTT